MTIHACPPHAQVAGVCSWRHHFEDVDLECDSPCAVGSDECDGTDHPHRVSLLKALPRGFYPQLTGGLGSVEYLRHVRGECGPGDACEAPLDVSPPAARVEDAGSRPLVATVGDEGAVPRVRVGSRVRRRSEGRSGLPGQVDEP